MAKSKKGGKSIDPRLVQEVTSAARQAFTQLRERHPGERFYAYALVTDGDAVDVGPAANSEEGLRRKATEYGQKRPAEWLRWGVDEWAYVDEGQESFKKAQGIVGARLEDDESPKKFAERKAATLTAFADALKALDAEGFFGTGRERAKVTLIVHITDASGSEWETMATLASSLHAKGAADAFIKYARSSAEEDDDQDDDDDFDDE